MAAATAVWAADAKPSARVLVTKEDKTTIAGELVDTSPAGVTVKTSSAADPIFVPWAEIKRVSSGLTRQRIVEEWKITKADRLCENCHGDGTESCSACRGTGVDAAHSKPCDTCDGTGSTGRCPKCTDGKSPCPSPCLKANSFTGAKDDAGKRWRTFRGKSGSLRVSDAHIGEQVVMEKGDPVMKGMCPTCNGSTVVVCPTCHGTAKKECSTCHGAAVVGPACMECKVGRVVCKTCTGSGLKTPSPSRAAETNP